MSVVDILDLNVETKSREVVVSFTPTPAMICDGYAKAIERVDVDIQRFSNDPSKLAYCRQFREEIIRKLLNFIDNTITRAGRIKAQYGLDKLISTTIKE